jgi:hypothetical protein
MNQGMVIQLIAKRPGASVNALATTAVYRALSSPSPAAVLMIFLSVSLRSAETKATVADGLTMVASNESPF